MRLLITLMLLTSGTVQAIDSCNEHSHCPPQGLVHIMVAPKIASEHQNLCDGSSFAIRFSLQMGRPIDIIVESGPKALRPAIVESFKKWRFGTVKKVKGAIENVVLEPDCSLQDRVISW